MAKRKTPKTHRTAITRAARPKKRRAAAIARRIPKAAASRAKRTRPATPRASAKAGRSARPRPGRTQGAAPKRAAVKVKRAPKRPRASALPKGGRRRIRKSAATVPAEGMSDARMLAAARTGQIDTLTKRRLHTESSPALTGGDPDARWEDAYAVGDEAPGGDNPTPDQTRVDEIGRALGVEYQDDQELQGGDELTKRDEHRWELDPASSDDWPHKDRE